MMEKDKSSRNKVIKNVEILISLWKGAGGGTLSKMPPMHGVEGQNIENHMSGTLPIRD